MLQTNHDALSWAPHNSVQVIGHSVERWLNNITVIKCSKHPDGYVSYVTPRLTRQDLVADILHSGDDNAAHTIGLPGFQGPMFHGMRGTATSLRVVLAFLEERRMQCIPDHFRITFKSPVYPGDILHVFLPLVDMFRTINWAKLSLELENLTNNLRKKDLSFPIN